MLNNLFDEDLTGKKKVDSAKHEATVETPYVEPVRKIVSQEKYEEGVHFIPVGVGMYKVFIFFNGRFHLQALLMSTDKEAVEFSKKNYEVQYQEMKAKKGV